MRIPTQSQKYDIEKSGGEAYLVNAETGEPIPHDEPIFILRAKDKRAVEALYHYRNTCEDADHITAVEQIIHVFENFSARNSAKMKEPTTSPGMEF